MSIIREVQALWGGFTPQGLHRFYLLLSSDPFALIAGLVKASKSNLLCVQRRKAKTLWLGAFEDIQSDFINHGLYSPYLRSITERDWSWMRAGEDLCEMSISWQVFC